MRKEAAREKWKGGKEEKAKKIEKGGKAAFVFRFTAPAVCLPFVVLTILKYSLQALMILSDAKVS